jgi:ribosome biogenesis GTPase
MRATVYKSTGSWYSIKTEDGEWINARAAGKIRLQGLKTTNPIAVGDSVIARLEGENNAVIESVNDRKNYIIRKSNKLSKQTQILASNIDTLLIIASIKNPKTSLGFIDRLTVAAVAYKIEPIVCFNKRDIWSDEDKETYEKLVKTYNEAGFKVVSSCATSPNGTSELFELLQNKRVVLSGHSGVGKSSLLNAFNPDLTLKVGAISDTHFKGKHTTTFAEMFDINDNTQFIDTPGIRDFGLIHIEEEELPNYFPEMFALLPDCKYYNCKHTNEPHCAVQKALEKGELRLTRYNSYLSILANEDIYQ